MIAQEQHCTEDECLSENLYRATTSVISVASSAGLNFRKKMCNNTQINNVSCMNNNRHFLH